VIDFSFFAERSCLSKENLTEEEANRVVDQALITNSPPLVLYYYKCQICGSHHMTRQQPEQRDEIHFI
jgi:hypothetical protein